MALPRPLVLPVRSVAKGLSTDLAAISEAQQTVISYTLEELRKPLGPGYKNYMVRFATLSQTTTLQNQLKQASPSQVTDALVKAHNALRDAVNDPKESFRRFRAKPCKKIVDGQAASPSSWKMPRIAP